MKKTPWLEGVFSFSGVGAAALRNAAKRQKDQNSATLYGPPPLPKPPTKAAMIRETRKRSSPFLVMSVERMQHLLSRPASI
jgi:hypothetical protein